jgi:hypothetical protein
MAITTILFKRGNSPLPPNTLLPGEPGWVLDTGELYIGMPDGSQKKINTLTTEELIEIIREYAPNTITGGNIYIQNTEPSDPDCVWIDTNGIDLITE